MKLSTWQKYLDEFNNFMGYCCRDLEISEEEAKELSKFVNELNPPCTDNYSQELKNVLKNNSPLNGNYIDSYGDIFYYSESDNTLFYFDVKWRLVICENAIDKIKESELYKVNIHV